MISEFNKYLIIFFFIWIFTSVIYTQEIKEYSSFKLNEIQVIGSHNSYKKAIEPSLWKLINSKDSLLAKSLQYEHVALDKQLELGLRSLELDVYLDPEGGKYSKPLGLNYLHQLGIPADSYDLENELSQPGLKVFHIQDFDFRSAHLLFVNCLREIKKWSDSNKNHFPIIITINAKDSKLNFDGANTPLLFGKKELESIDTEIRRIFSESDLITPDLIRGKFLNIKEAVLTNGWPNLDEIKGRVLFLLDETGKKLDEYLNEDKSLTGKVMFVNAEESSINAAVMIINDPIKDQNEIKNLVSKSFLVRTRADSETIEARKNELTRFEAAVNSGAQIISTDYYLPSQLFKSSYQVIFNNGSYSRINPLLKKFDYNK